MKRILWPLLASLILCACAAAPSQDPPPSKDMEDPWKDSHNVVGAKIVADIKALVVDGCYGPSFIPAGWYVPKELRNHTSFPSLDAPIDAELHASVSLDDLIRRAHPDETFRSTALRDLSLDSIAMDFPDPVPVSNADTAIYSFNCTSTLNTALDNSVQLPLGILQTSVKQGLNFQANTGTRVLVMYGTFESPLIPMLSAGAPEKFRAQAASALWAYLLRHPPAKAEDGPFVVKTFTGWVESKESSRDDDGAVSVNSSTKVSSVGVSADISANAKLTYKQSQSTRLFDIWFDNVAVGAGEKKPNWVPERLGNVAKINEVVDKLLVVVPSSTPYVSSSPIHLSASIADMSDYLCRSSGKGNWSIEQINPPTTGQNASITNVVTSFDHGVCLIKADLIPLGSKISKIELSIKNAGYPISVGGTATYIGATRNVDLQETTQPVIQFASPPKFIQDTANSSAFQVTADLAYVAPDARLSSPKIANLTEIACTPAVTFSSADLVVAPKASEHQATLEGKVTALGTVAANTTCSVSLHVKATLDSQGQSTSEITLPTATSPTVAVPYVAK